MRLARGLANGARHRATQGWLTAKNRGKTLELEGQRIRVEYWKDGGYLGDVFVGRLLNDGEAGLKGSRVAIKVNKAGLPPKLAHLASLDRADRASQQAAPGAKGHVVRSFGTTVFEGREAQVMELLQRGTPLARKLRGEPLDPSSSVKLALEILQGLTALHARRDQNGRRKPKAIHGDLHPDNVLYLPERGVVIIDPTAVQNSAEFRKGLLKGEKYQDYVMEANRRADGYYWDFHPPEQFRDGRVGAHTDTYAVGGWLILALTGRKPEPDPRDDNLDLIPEPLRPIVKKARSPNHARRYQSATEMTNALQRATRDLSRGNSVSPGDLRRAGEALSDLAM